jgi:hypothetical protein
VPLQPLSAAASPPELLEELASAPPLELDELASAPPLELEELASAPPLELEEVAPEELPEPLELLDEDPLPELLLEAPLDPADPSLPPSSPVAPGLLELLQPAAMPRTVARAAENNKVLRVDFMARPLNQEESHAYYRAEGVLLPPFDASAGGPRPVPSRKPRK